MDPERLRGELREAAAALPTGSENPRRAVARRVHRRRLAESLALMAAVVAIAVGFGLVTRPTIVDENRVEFADPPVYPSDTEWPTTVSPDTGALGTAPSACTGTVPPAEGTGELVVVYLPCVSGDTVARVYRWLPDPSALELVRAVMDGPLVDEQQAGRVALFDGPASGLVSDVEFDGPVARITMNDNVAGLSSALRNARGLIAAVEATVFTAYDEVDRIEFRMDTTATPSAFCGTTGLPGDCAAVERSQWAVAPSGWRRSPPISTGSIGTFGDTRPAGALSIRDVVVTAGGHSGGTVTAVDAGDGSARWVQTLDGDTSFVADQTLGDAVLAAPEFGPVTAIDAGSGKVRWSLALPAGQSPGPPTVMDGVVYLPATFTTEGDERAPMVAAVDAASGERLWRTRLRAETDLQWAPPTVTEDLVLVADTPSGPQGTSRLHALDRDDGDVEWTFTFASRRQQYHDHQPLMHEGRLLATMHGTLYALDPKTGNEQWRAEAGAGPVGVVPGGVVVELESGITTLEISDGSVR